jgi:hypothetical protein
MKITEDEPLAQGSTFPNGHDLDHGRKDDKTSNHLDIGSYDSEFGRMTRRDVL